MKVSVVLIAYDGDDWLPSCLSSLAAASSERLHLVLVDNAGNSVLDKLDLCSFESEVLNTPRPMGFAEANNFALVNASHLEAATLFLNQDTVSKPGWIDECLNVLREEHQLGAISPLISTYDDDGWDPSFLDCLSVSQQHLLERPEVGQKWMSTQAAPAPALLVRTSVLRQAGPFDPVFGSYYEDYDLCRRIRQLGYRVGFCRTASIRHYSGSTTTTPERERKRMRQIIRNRVLYQLREVEGARWMKVLLYGLIDFPRRLLRGLVSTPSSQPPGVTLQAYGDLLRVFPRLLSAKYDEAVWQEYLSEIGWSLSVATTDGTNT